MTVQLPPKPRFQRLLHDSLICAAHEHPDKVALITENWRVTYAQLFEHVRRCASALIARGVKRGDRVVIYLDNTLECVIGVWATLWAGGAFVIVNPQTKKDKLQYIIDRSEAKVLISDGHLWQQFFQMLSQSTPLVSVLCSNVTRKHLSEPTQVRIEDYWQVLKQEQPLERSVFVIPLDLAALIFTSGSTGMPKGVTMIHQSMVFARDSITEYLRLGTNERIVNMLPLAFDYGLYQMLMAVGLGATLVLERSFTYPGTVFDRIQKEEVTVFPGVPTIYSTLLSMHQKSALCFPSIRRVTNTAAALPPDYIPTLRKIFPNALVFPMYGLTECKRVSYLEPELVDVKPGSVGKPVPGTEMFLLSPEGNPVPPGEPGILHVRGPHVMLGYWKDPETTAKMIKPGNLPGERVLCAQDWFIMDEDGFFYFKGRSDDIIKTRGEKVSPVEVENVLYSMQGIKEAAVIGVPDENLGQAIQAFVVLDNGVGISAKEIQKYCAARLENFMVPQRIEFLSELPRTANGKIKKTGLR
jgi:acyl-coenzyme A synthetase/AMP-(fatty) acid ligase